MDKIEYDGPGELWLGDIDQMLYSMKAFDTVISVCQDPCGIENAKRSYHWYNMSDAGTGEGGVFNQDMFDDAADMLYHTLMRDGSVAIHCHVGMSRSVGVASASLARLLQVPFEQSHDIILERRGKTSMKDGVEKCARRYVSYGSNNASSPL